MSSSSAMSLGTKLVTGKVIRITTKLLWTTNEYKQVRLGLYSCDTFMLTNNFVPPLLSPCRLGTNMGTSVKVIESNYGDRDNVARGLNIGNKSGSWVSWQRR